MFKLREATGSDLEAIRDINEAAIPAVNTVSLEEFLYESIVNIGTSACPPYHLAIVIGGTSAEFTMKTLKLATIRYLDNLSLRSYQKIDMQLAD